MRDRLGPPGAVYTRTCVQRCFLVGLREPRKSDGSSDWPRAGRKITSMDVGAVSIGRDLRKSTMCDYLAHKANLLWMKIAWYASKRQLSCISPRRLSWNFDANRPCSRCSALYMRLWINWDKANINAIYQYIQYTQHKYVYLILNVYENECSLAQANCEKIQ